ncbi:peptidylprolyl isomerase [Candidatus Gottesmanbacteria bacterium RBG_13_37_7]|uniref:Peptidyl-prolyl cis-trans isomerase n=1 Tax=Candidatus Gottesmanbacteria bacterium RBG_13_37_7 TaxID=1798369 RepID=A0A1F5YJN8_9BACT|nr:MAG: peptidylprolyl isomerase [Candidatus Gottesmanbacteria bacterium RBG_13_37_7]
MKLDLTKKYQAILNTEKGPINIDLFTKETSVTVNNFVFLAGNGFYNNTVFHRVIKGFMIQGGDPLGTGAGGPGYKFNDEKIIREYKRGIVAMANSGPNTNGSQFFIMHQDYNLPKSYVIFGQVTSGMDTVDKIAESEVTDSGNNEKSKPVSPVKIISIDIKEE